MLNNIRQDYLRARELRRSKSPLFLLECLLFETGFQAILLFRLGHWFKSRGVPFLGPFFGRLSQFLTGVEIGPAARIGPGCFIGHANGIVIGGEVELGARAFLLQQVTLGSPSAEPDRRAEMPSIGDDVFIAAGAKVIGAVTIGSNVFIGANALVTEDVPSNSRVLANDTIRVTSTTRRHSSQSQRVARDM